MRNEKLEIRNEKFFVGSNWVCFPFLFVLLRAEGEFCKKIKKNKNNYFKY